MVTYGGIPLELQSESARAWIGQVIPRPGSMPTLRRSWPGKSLTHIAWPTGWCEHRAAAVGEVRWPTGAARWAEASFLCTGDYLKPILAAAYGPNGGQLHALPLVVRADGLRAKETWQADMYLLPPTPLADPTADSPGLYHLLLVDDRYLWWQLPVPKVGIGQGVPWATLINAYATRIGRSIAFDPPDPAYLGPDPTLDVMNQPLPDAFDAIATNLSCRVVVAYDWSVSLQSQATAQLNADAQDSLPLRTKRAGGDRFLDVAPR